MLHQKKTAVRRSGLPIAAALLLATLFPNDVPAQSVVRGPYLQLGTPSSIVVRWRTDVPTDSEVRFATAPGSLTSSVSDATTTTEHELRLTGLSANTTYYYSVGTTTQVLAGDDAGHFFTTSPAAGTVTPTRIWVLGDSGTADENALAVRDAYVAFTGTVHTDLWLMLGDNAYPDGTDSEYQAAVFDMYPTMLRKSVLWSTLGNHDGHTADSATQTGPYYDIFTLPTKGEAGGLASGTEAYYSFDYANIHFICLDSYETDRSPGGAMMTWLEEDLANTLQDWVIAFWHHPPYSKGSHDSDIEDELIEMRENALPLLEEGGVDLVLSGHSHSYERSFLIDGHYGSSNTLTSSMILDGGDGTVSGDGAYEKPTAGLAAHEGCVYVVSGASGKVKTAPLDHPAMFISLALLGSLVLDIDGLQLDAHWIDSTGTVQDRFTIIKGTSTPPPAPSGLVATARSDSEIDLEWSDNSTDEDGFHLERSLDGESWSEIATVGTDVTSYSDSGLSPMTTYFYRVRSFNAAGFSAYSETASEMTFETDAVTSLATGEISVAGTVDGTFADTHDSDDVYESITERHSGGKPALRHSFLEHVWTFDVASGGTITFSVEAHHTMNGEGDDFVFAYSTDDVNYTDLLTITKTSDDDRAQTILLPSTLSGTIYVRVLDTDRSPGNSTFDTLSVDHLEIHTTFGSSDSSPPTAPEGLEGVAVHASRIDLDWLDNPEADLASYNIYRDTSPGGPYSLIASGLPISAYSDTGLSESTTYYYVVTALDTSGNESPPSNEAMATTPSCAPVTMHVASIVATVENLGKGERRGLVEVTIVDDCGHPVSGANVTGTFTGDFNEVVSAPTDSSGVAVLLTGSKKGQASYTLCVDDAAHASLTYDAGANVETCDGT